MDVSRNHVNDRFLEGHSETVVDLVTIFVTTRRHDPVDGPDRPVGISLEYVLRGRFRQCLALIGFLFGIALQPLGLVMPGMIDFARKCLVFVALGESDRDSQADGALGQSFDRASQFVVTQVAEGGSYAGLEGFGLRRGCNFRSFPGCPCRVQCTSACPYCPG